MLTVCGSSFAVGTAAEGPSLPKRAADDDEEEEQEEEVAAEKDQQGAAPATHLNLDEEDEELFDGEHSLMQH